MTVSFEPSINIKSPITKQKNVAAINSIYDVSGWSSPVLTMKLLSRNVCLLKLNWDKILPLDIAQLRFIDSRTTAKGYVPRYIQWSTKVNPHQSLLVVKSRVASKGTSIPTIELIAERTIM